MIHFNDNDYILTDDTRAMFKEKVDLNSNTVLNKAYKFIVDAKSDKELTIKINELERYCNVRRKNIRNNNSTSAIYRDLVIKEMFLDCVKCIIIGYSISPKEEKKIKTKKRNSVK